MGRAQPIRIYLEVVAKIAATQALPIKGLENYNRGAVGTANRWNRCDSLRKLNAQRLRVYRKGEEFAAVIPGSWRSLPEGSTSLSIETPMYPVNFCALTWLQRVFL